MTLARKSEQAAASDYNCVTLRFILIVAIGLAFAGRVSADENVRQVEEKLRDGGFYSGELDGAYNSQLADALTRFQTSKGIPVTGQLDVDTSSALGAKPAVTKHRAAPDGNSDTSRHSRKREQKTVTDARERSSPGAEETESSAEMQPRSAPSTTVQTSSEITETASAPTLAGSEETRPVSAPPTAGQTSSASTKLVSAPAATERISSETTKPASAPATVSSSSGGGDVSTERLRDYVGAFVHAGLDPNVGSEADFFANRVKYYDQGVVDREKIRSDLQDYAARWPERHFWFAGNITIEPQHGKHVRVTFPLRYDLRNGATYSSGTINKTLVLEPVGDNLQIVAVSEGNAD